MLNRLDAIQRRARIIIAMAEASMSSSAIQSLVQRRQTTKSTPKIILNRSIKLFENYVGGIILIKVDLVPCSVGQIKSPVVCPGLVPRDI